MGLRSRSALGGVVLLGTCGASSAAAAPGAPTLASCMLNAPVAFSTPITMQASNGELSGAGTVRCDGVLGGAAVASSAPVEIHGRYGDQTPDPVMSPSGNDTCLAGYEYGRFSADVPAASGPLHLVGSFVLTRTASLVSGAASGRAGDAGWDADMGGTLSGNGCMGDGMSSAMLSVHVMLRTGSGSGPGSGDAPAPEPGPTRTAAPPAPGPAAAAPSRRGHRAHRGRRGHRHGRRAGRLHHRH